MKIEREIGSGNEFVYAYYFPSQAGGNSWPHKIGRATIDPIRRIRQQRAAMQEEPVIGTLLRCDKSQYYEAVAHIALEHRRLPGDREWFNVHPNALENVYTDGLNGLSISQQVRLWRLMRGLTQQQLAKYAGLRQEQVSKIEKGNNFTFENLQELARELGVKIILADDV